ncbi:MAG: gliding motility-associated C-terminal domain-containing protein, partial [Flavisolibacter sp.]|nr:gliding motility-associated C-terminal domain-containing protein [Flavisolibacter sp.]
VVLVNTQNVVIDEVQYSEKWHFELLRDREGVALERVDPDGPSQEAKNWRSAAAAAGYGTPGYKNSQYQQDGGPKATIEIIPKTFSPDGDGVDDAAFIHYQAVEPGFVASVTIYESNGRPVRSLVHNQTLGLKGSWSWDGLDAKGQKLPIGIYIIYTELFNLQGKREQFKNTVVLARRFN